VTVQEPPDPRDPEARPTTPAAPAERPGPLTAGADYKLNGAPMGGGHPPAPDAGEVPIRPTVVDPEHLGFTPRSAVPWLNPILLAGTALRVVLAELFGAYLDKRELQSALPADAYDERPKQSDELWLDYVADLGDGFNATYSIAYLLAQRVLAVDEHTLPRGDVLVMGGDQVYPTASGQQYEDRFKGPYRAALPEPPPDRPQPRLYALPGNHDWYDGLTAFLRLFARVEEGHVGGWRTRQHRSYFVLRLPNRWWLFAIDVQFGAYLDEPQLRYFRQMAARLQPGDRVILCPPAPNWVQAKHGSTAYDTIDYFVRKILDPTGADVRVMIAGDLHHYARYSNPARELITCGGGGAYLYGTHRLPKCIEVPPRESIVRTGSKSRVYDRASTYPTRWRSLWLAAGVFVRLPLRNMSFTTVVGVLHVLLMLAFANAMQRIGSGVTQSLVTIPLGFMIMITLGSTVAFAMPTSGGARRIRHWVLGFGHGLAQLGLGYLGAQLWLRLPLFELTFPLPLLAAIVTYLPPISLAATTVIGVYLLIASSFDVNVNELFAAQGIVDVKCFLRMHFAADGSLTIYPIAVDRVGRKWRANPRGAPHEPWLEPEGPIHCRLAEHPIHLP